MPDTMTALETVALETVVPHPANPRGPVNKATDDHEHLVESITELGILQAPIVLPADRVAAAWPEYAADIAGAAYVVLLGHRRVAAAMDVYGTRGHVQVAIRTDDLADDPDQQYVAMTAENVGRKSLSPMQEARAFGRLRDRGMSERAIAAAVSCSPSHVHKRLQLRRLPDGAAAALEAEKIDVSTATRLAKLDRASDREEVWDTYAQAAAKRDATGRTVSRTLLRDEFGPANLNVALDDAEPRIEDRNKRESSEREAEEQEVQLVDPYERFGFDHRRQRLMGGEIAQARDAGTLLAAPDGTGGLDYYSTEPPARLTHTPPPPRAPEPSAEDLARAAHQQQWDEAQKLREASVRKLALTRPEWPEDLPHQLAVAGLIVPVPDDDAVDLLYQWLEETPLRTKLPPVDKWGWAARLIELPWQYRVAAAHASAVVHAEVRLRDNLRNGQPEASDVDYLRSLADVAGHNLHPFEIELIDAHDHAAAEAALTGLVAREYPSGFELHHDDEHGWEIHGPHGLIASHDGLPHGEDEAARHWAASELSASGVPVTNWTECTDGVTTHYEAVLAAGDDCE